MSKNKPASEELVKREALFRRLTENSPAVIYQFQMAPDGKFSFPFISGQVENILGISADEIMHDSSTLLALIHPDDVQRFQERVIQSATKLEKYTDELRGVLADKTVWIEAHSMPEAQSDGTIIWDGFLIDITERKVAEKVLRESDEKFRLAMEATHDGLWDYNIPTGKVYYSNAWKNILEEQEVEPVYESWESRIHPQDKAKTLNALQEHLTGKTDFWEYEHRLKTSQGKWKWVLGKGRVVEKDRNGNPLRMVGTATDITERKRVEVALKQSEVKFRALVEQAGDAFELLDENARYIDINEVACRQTGFSREEFLEMSIPDIDPSVSLEQYRSRFESLSREGKPITFESVHKRKDGRTFPVEITASVLRLGNTSFALSLARDITKRRKTEEALKESRTHLSNALRLGKLGHWEYDVSSNMFTFTDEFYAIFHTTAEEMGGYTMKSDRYAELFLHPDDKWMVAEEVRKAIETPDPNYSRRIEHRIIYADGTTGNIAVRFQIVKDSKNHTIKTFGVNQDITEQKQVEDILRESDARLKKLSIHVPGMIYQFMKKPDGTYCVPFSTEAIEEVFGCSPEDVREDFSPIAKVILPEDLDKVVRSIEDSAEHLTPWQCEYRVQIPGQTVGWRLGHSTPEKLADGSIIWYGFNTDITERKRAEEALKENVRLNKIILDNFPCVALLLRPYTREIVASNNEGVKVGAVPGACCFSTWGQREKSCPWCLAPEVWATGQAQSLEVESGGIVWDAHWIPVDENLYMHYAFDITKRKQSEEALRESEHRYRELFDNSPVAIWEEDFSAVKTRIEALRAAGVRDFRSHLDNHPEEVSQLASLVRIVKVNEISLRMLGCESKEQLFLDLPRYFTEESLAIFKEEMIALEAGLLGFHSELPIRDVAGRKLLLELTLSVSQGHEETLSCVMVSFSDITERRRAEEEKARLESQLLQAQKMESVGRLAGGVAHDFNNMLGVILGHSEMALNQVDPAQPLHDNLEEIRKAANRSADLTRQLLAFARRQTVKPAVLNLNEAIVGTLKMLKRLIGEDIDLQWKPKSKLWPVKMDPSQIDQIMANLCVNARDAIAYIGKVTIETGNSVLDADYCARHVGFEPGEYVLLAVSDDGCGMDKETLANVFDPFFTTKEVGQGTGLGLATVYGIVKQNNGFIDVYSEPGQGTTFKIFLPRCDIKTELKQKEGAAKPHLRGQETILLAEDEPAILEMTVKLLESQGYTVLAAGTPGEAIRLAMEYTGQIHLLMTDVVMPEMNGRDLANNLISICPGIKRLFTSGYTANVIAHHGVLDEGMHYIQKPFSLKDLAAKVREVLDEV